MSQLTLTVEASVTWGNAFFPVEPWCAIFACPMLDRCSLAILAITELTQSVRGFRLEELLSFIGNAWGLRG